MASTPENKVKARVVDILQGFNAYYFFPATHGYGRSGVPDVVAASKGLFLGVECKAGDGKPTALQMRELMRIREAGGFSCVVRERTIPHFAITIRLLSYMQRWLVFQRFSRPANSPGKMFSLEFYVTESGVCIEGVQVYAEGQNVTIEAFPSFITTEAEVELDVMRYAVNVFAIDEMHAFTIVRKYFSSLLAG